MTAGIIKTSDGRWSPVSRSNRMRSLWLAALFALVIVLLAASVTVGTRNVGWDDVAAAMGGAQNNIDRASVALRIPRTVLALLAGGALGLAGAIMQGVTRNPLADPGILGVNMGHLSRSSSASPGSGCRRYMRTSGWRSWVPDAPRSSSTP